MGAPFSYLRLKIESGISGVPARQGTMELSIRRSGRKAQPLRIPLCPPPQTDSADTPADSLFLSGSERDVRLFSSTNSSPDGPSCPLPFQNRPPASVPPFVLLRKTMPYVPVLPNPPVPRAVSSSACTGSNSTARYGITTSCAIRSSGVTTRTLSESLCNTTIYSPR